MSERGEVSLTALLVTALLMIVILLATLTTFDNFTKQNRGLTGRNDVQDQARSVVDTLARTLRNLAGPTPDQPQAIDQASAYDVVYKTVDKVGPNTGQNASNVRRVRWCLSSTGTLYQQVQTWTTAAVPAMPSTATCPSSAWPKPAVFLAGHLANMTLSDPLFVFDSANPSLISRVAVNLRLLQTNLPAASALSLRTGVFLRNQNRPPTASFTATKTAQGVVLNGSASTDPEGQTLDLDWFDGTTQIGTGPLLTYSIKAGTTHSFTLRATDPAGLISTAPAQVITG